MPLLDSNQTAPLQALGPDGVRRRIEEIRAKIASVNGHPDDSFRLPEGGLSGSIGGSGFAPAEAFGSGLRLSSPAATPQMQKMITDAAIENGVDPALFDALVSSESSYDPNARSRAGALGLSQLMPDTAKGLGVLNPFDPMQNLQGGAKYLRQMLDKFGDIPRALAAYNAGPGKIHQFGGIPPYTETQKYVDRIMKIYQSRRAG